MTIAVLLATRLLLGVGVALTAAGAVSAWTTNNVLKRIAAIAFAFGGALLVLAALGAPSIAVLAGAIAVFAYSALAAALVVRAHEDYGGVDVSDMDAADAAAEPAEPRA